MENFSNIKKGDVLTHKETGESYVVTAKYNNGDTATLVRTIRACSPEEWQLYRRVKSNG